MVNWVKNEQFTFEEMHNILQIKGCLKGAFVTVKVPHR